MMANLNRSFVASVAVIVTAFVLILSAMSPASAARPPYYNSDPYGTGCAANSYVLASGAVPGGRMSLAVSRTCGTNWVEYRGTRQKVAKRISCPDCDPYAATTQVDTDTASWSYSMQVYAPRVSDMTYGSVSLQGRSYKIVCARNCTFYRVN